MQALAVYPDRKESCIMADKSKRGFASMDPEKQQEIARLSGQTSHGLRKAHRFTSEEAREAGKKGSRRKSTY
jgi:hypothetical protein